MTRVSGRTESVADRLRGAIKAWGSISAFAEVMSARRPRAKGSSRQMILHYLSSEVDPPLEFLTAAAEVLRRRPAWLAFGDGAPTKEEEEERTRQVESYLAGTTVRTLEGRFPVGTGELIAARRMELQGRSMVAEAMIQQAIDREQTLTTLIVDALNAGQSPDRLRAMRSIVHKEQDETNELLAQTRAELRLLRGSPELYFDVPAPPTVVLSGPDDVTAPVVDTSDPSGNRPGRRS